MGNGEENEENEGSEDSESEKTEKCKVRKRRNKDLNDIDNDLLSPHRRQKMEELPQKINAMIASRENHLKLLETLNVDTFDTKKICDILRESEKLKKSQCDIQKKLNEEFLELMKNGQSETEKLNKNIQEINDKH